MKTKCNVAKDLMPLVIDGVASEESQQYVDEHIAECTECALSYGAMKIELPRISAEKERAELERAAKKLRRKRILRAIAASVAGILVFLALSMGVPRVLDAVEEKQFAQRYLCENGDIRLEGLYYDVCLDERRAPIVQVNIDSFPSGSPGFDTQLAFVPVNDNMAICLQYRAVYLNEGLQHNKSAVFYWAGRAEDGVWLGLADGLRDEDDNLVSLPIVRIELHAGDDYVVLWEEGDVVQTAEEAKIKHEQELQKYNQYRK